MARTNISPWESFEGSRNHELAGKKIGAGIYISEFTQFEQAIGGCIFLIYIGKGVKLMTTEEGRK